MPITYVINLARSRGRRRTVTQALRRAGVPFELVPAVDGATLPAELVARAIEPGRFYRASAAAVACALSHRDVRRAVAARGEPVAVVIEDDCVPAARFAATVRDIAGVVDGRTVVLLYAECIHGIALRRTPVHALGSVNLFEPVSTSDLTSALAYVITADAAASLGTVETPTFEPDRWGRFLELGLLDRVLVAHPFIAGNALYSSTIGYTDDRMPRRLKNLFDALPGLRAHLRRRRGEYVARISAVSFVDD